VVSRALKEIAGGGDGDLFVGGEIAHGVDEAEPRTVRAASASAEVAVVGGWALAVAIAEIGVAG